MKVKDLVKKDDTVFLEIKNPIEVERGSCDEGQECFMAQRLILNYMNYLLGVADTLGMTIEIASSPDCTNFPFIQFRVMDGKDELGEFIFQNYSFPLYERFREWVIIDILYYMKSKQLYIEFDKKFPASIKWGNKSNPRPSSYKRTYRKNSKKKI